MPRRTELRKLLPRGSVLQSEGLDAAANQSLIKALKPSIWGSVAKHRSVNFEVGGLAVIRYWAKGQRLVVLVNAEPLLDSWRKKQSEKCRGTDTAMNEVLTSAHAVQWMMYADVDAIQEFLDFCSNKGSELQMPGYNMFYGKLDPGCALYVPAGMITCDMNFDEDNFSVKAACVIPGDVLGGKALRRLKQEAKDFGKGAPAHLEQLLQNVEHWQKLRAEQATKDAESEEAAKQREAEQKAAEDCAKQKAAEDIAKDENDAKQKAAEDENDAKQKAAEGLAKDQNDDKQKAAADFTKDQNHDKQNQKPAEDFAKDQNHDKQKAAEDFSRTRTTTSRTRRQPRTLRRTRTTTSRRRPRTLRRTRTTTSRSRRQPRPLRRTRTTKIRRRPRTLRRSRTTPSRRQPRTRTTQSRRRPRTWQSRRQPRTRLAEDLLNKGSRT